MFRSTLIFALVAAISRLCSMRSKRGFLMGPEEWTPARLPGW